MNRYCELHVHLEGCVWPQHIRKWWTRSELRFPAPRARHEHDAPFESFLEHLRYGYNFLGAVAAYAEVAALYAAQAARQGIVYAELQINLALLRAWKLDLTAVLDAIAERVATVPGAPVLRFIIDLPWQFDPALLLPVVDGAADLHARGVRGISLGGRETEARPRDVAPICGMARSAGLKVVCHAGETPDADLARRIVDALRPDRVTHAVSIADWVTAQGPQAPPIDVCLVSNLELAVVKDLAEHPLRRWWDAGVTVCLATDDPAVFGTTLAREYEIAAQICPGLTTDHERRAAHWLRAALDPEAARMALDAAAP